MTSVSSAQISTAPTSVNSILLIFHELQVFPRNPGLAGFKAFAQETASLINVVDVGEHRASLGRLFTAVRVMYSNISCIFPSQDDVIEFFVRTHNIEPTLSSSRRVHPISLRTILDHSLASS